MEELKFLKCEKCGAFVEVLNTCECDNCGISCCKQKMQEVVLNSSGDENAHMPMLKRKDKNLYILVDHVMEEEHYIYRIVVQTEKEEFSYNLTLEDDPSLIIPYQGHMKVYAFCNKHGVWMGEID